MANFFDLGWSIRGGSTVFQKDAYSTFIQKFLVLQ